MADRTLPLDRWGAALLLAASLGLLAAMPAWWTPSRPGSSAGPAEGFQARLEAMVTAHATGREADGMPVVRPPPGDVYLSAERYRFYPALELEAGQSYRLLVAATDVVHGIALGPHERILLPGQVVEIKVPTDRAGLFSPQCSEFCGNGHNRMKGRIEIVSTGAGRP